VKRLQRAAVQSPQQYISRKYYDKYKYMYVAIIRVIVARRYLRFSVICVPVILRGRGITQTVSLPDALLRKSSSRRNKWYCLLFITRSTIQRGTQTRTVETSVYISASTSCFWGHELRLKKKSSSRSHDRISLVLGIEDAR